MIPLRVLLYISVDCDLHASINFTYPNLFIQLSICSEIYCSDPSNI